MKSQEKELWKTGFGKRYIDTVAIHIKPEYTEKQVSFIEKNLGLVSGYNILDAGCGQGRHAIEFAKRGYEVTGFDFSEDLLKYAEKKAEESDLDISFIQGDLRELSFESEFDAAISILAFGFLDTDEDNLLSLKNISQALKPSGKFFLAVSNVATVIERMKSDPNVKNENGVLTQNKQIANGDIIINLEIELDTHTAKHTVMAGWEEDNQTYKDGSTVHMYTLDELEKMADESGLKIEQKWGDFDGGEFSDSSPLLLLSLSKK